MYVSVGSHSGVLAAQAAVEVVERKGPGHPDTLCDAIAEDFSRLLCKFYEERFGLVLHHNVDKALLFGGASRPCFGGGEILSPIEMYLAGRATVEVGGVVVPVRDLAEEAASSRLSSVLHAMDKRAPARVHCLVRAGSADLVAIYERQQKTGVFLANDTSFGAGFWPLSDLERVVLAAERVVSSAASRGDLWVGEDVKVMGVRIGNEIRLTIACAMIGRYLKDVDDYLSKKQKLVESAIAAARAVTSHSVVAEVNVGDAPQRGSVYLTVTGTSAESGDDGQVGRGNRVNGLITPLRPMTLEAAAGKNPVTHVGKLYNIAATKICQAIVAALPEVASASCLLVSQIGRSVTDPQSTSLYLEMREGKPISSVAALAEQIARAEIEKIPTFSAALIRGEISVW